MANGTRVSLQRGLHSLSRVDDPIWTGQIGLDQQPYAWRFVDFYRFQAFHAFVPTGGAIV